MPAASSCASAGAEIPTLRAIAAAESTEKALGFHNFLPCFRNTYTAWRCMHDELMVYKISIDCNIISEQPVIDKITMIQHFILVIWSILFCEPDSKPWVGGPCLYQTFPTMAELRHTIGCSAKTWKPATLLGASFFTERVAAPCAWFR